MYKSFRMFLCIMLCIVIVSCATDNTPKPKPMNKLVNSKDIRIKWNFSALSRTDVAPSLVPYSHDGILFVADSSGEFFKLDSTDGTLINKFISDKNISGGVVVSNSYMFATTEDAYLIAINRADGSTSWQVRLSTLATEPPQVINNVLVVKTNDGEVSAYQADSGKLLWVHQTANPALTLRNFNSFQILDKDVVAVGQAGGRLTLLNLLNGTAIWDTYVAMPDGATDLDKLTDVTTKPVLSNNVICVATYNGKITCLDALSGNLIWAKKFSSHQGLVVDANLVYAVSTDGVVVAFDKLTGRIAWNNDSLEYRELSAPVFLGEDILLIDDDGYLHLFDHNTGAEISRKKTHFTDGASIISDASGAVYVQSANGYVASITL